jgi:hypothetical protein
LLRNLDANSVAARAIKSVFGARRPRAVAADLAGSLLNRSGFLGAPYDAEAFAQLLGVPVERAPIAADGVLTGWPDSPRIILKALGAVPLPSERRRQNFTLAHELGHYVIRRELTGSLGQITFSASDPVEEALCNTFAAELLMPHREFVTDAGTYGISPDACLFLADKYKVSLTAILSRIGDFAAKGSNYMAVFFHYCEGEFAASWATPTQYRSTLVTRNGRTSMERALGTGKVCWGDDAFRIDRKQKMWKCVSMRLPQSSKVLTVGRRVSCPFPFRRPAPPPREIANESPQLVLF